jgi:copper transport protein
MLLAALGMLAAAPAASAHASLVSSSPADGALLARAPARVSSTFDEQVSISADSLKVFAPNGDRVDTGATTRGSRPAEITVALLPGLGRGTYTVGWHVVSDDSHPVQGAFTFSVGAPSATSVNPASLGPPAGTLVDVAFGIVRWLAFGSFALLIGAVAFVIWCWPAGAARRPVLLLAMSAWGGLAFSVLAAVLLQGAYGAGQGVGHVFWPDVLHATLHSRYGSAIGVRLLLVIVALFAFSITLGSLQTAGRRARVGAGAAWATLTTALAATWAVADHSGTGNQVPLAIPADVIHLSAMAIWLGGLVMLATIVLRRPRVPGPKPAGAAAARKGQAATAEAAQAVSRFSPIALGCVAAIVATGTYQAWRNVGTWGALTGTTYGRLLLVKIAAMCVLIGLGYLARRRIAAGISDAATAAAPSAAAVAARDTRAGQIDVRVGAGARPGPVKTGAGARPGRGGTGSDTRRSGGSVAGARRGGSGAGKRHSSGSRGRRGRGNGRAGAGPGQGKGAVGRPGQVNAGAARAAGGTGTATGAPQDTGRAAVSLARLRWSVALETVIAVAVLAVTAVLVNTPTGRESFNPPDSAAVAFDTGGPGGRGSLGATVTPARLGANQVRVSITGSAGRPYRPQQVQAALSLPARHLGPLSVPLTPDGAGRYLGPVTISIIGQWQLQVTIRSDAFDETTVTVPATIR